MKSECVRRHVPSNLVEAKRQVGEYIEQYNKVRLHSAIVLHHTTR
ncbi:MAG: transposase [Gammaproteobacteria bacterium]|nr:transposase [Gammaproteobacteria bacterium]